MRNAMLVEVEIWTVAKTDKGTAVLVKPIGSDRAIPIFIGQLEAHSILIGIGNIAMPRPLTHDLFLTLIEKMHAQVERIEINDCQDGTYFSRILLKQGIKKIVLDARPSDALGLAARVKCQIFVAEFIIDEASIPMQMIEEVADQVGSSEESLLLKIQETLQFNRIDEEPTGIDDAAFQDGNLLETSSDVQRAVLTMQLEKAISDENYEEAAYLRDLISSLGT